MIKNTLTKFAAAAIAAAALLTSSCSTDVDLLENYKPVTVVYGLLNVNDSIQYIKVNKAFLGEGNAMVMAQQSDSINYKPGDVTVQLQQINPSTGEVLQTINCDTTTQILKDPGTFYSPYQLLFKTTASLDENSNYKLVVNRVSDGAVITAVTKIIDDVTVTNPQPISQIPLYNANSQSYQTFNLRWNHTVDAFIYSAALQFTYYETLLVAPFTIDTLSITMNLGEVLAGNSAEGSSKEIKIQGEAFFNFIDATVKPNVNVQRSADEFLQIFLSAGTEDLQTYIDVNKPSIGIIQEKPVFTNINNGTGIFTSRWSTVLRNKMTSATVTKVNQIL